MAKRELNLRQKAIAINKLGYELSIKIDSNENWYASISHTEIRDHNGGLTNPVGRGTTVNEAIRELWDILTVLPEGSYIVKFKYRLNEQKLRWNGTIFEDLGKNFGEP